MPLPSISAGRCRPVLRNQLGSGSTRPWSQSRRLWARGYSHGHGHSVYRPNLYSHGGYSRGHGHIVYRPSVHIHGGYGHGGYSYGHSHSMCIYPRWPTNQNDLSKSLWLSARTKPSIAKSCANCSFG